MYSKYGIYNGIGADRSWALVTGGSDGIGLALCKVLAADYGFNILMVSRSEEKLERAQQDVLEYCCSQSHARHEIYHVEYAVVDFAKITTINEYEQHFNKLFK